MSTKLGSNIDGEALGRLGRAFSPPCTGSRIRPDYSMLVQRRALERKTGRPYYRYLYTGPRPHSSKRPTPATRNTAPARIPASLSHLNATPTPHTSPSKHHPPTSPHSTLLAATAPPGPGLGGSNGSVGGGGGALFLPWPPKYFSNS